MRLGPTLLAIGAVLFLLFVFLVPQWRLPGGGTQLGYRASSMIQFDPTPAEAAANRPPPPLPPIPADPRPASAVFKNVSVLTNTNAGDFMRLQEAMTVWVSPKQGCGFCHVGTDYASDAKPEKQAARVMLAMTRHINAAWRDHVGAAGVTCYSCHRGQPVPSEIWYQSQPSHPKPLVDKQDDWNESARTVRQFFPYEGYEEYLLEATPALGQSYTALPTGGTASLVEIKRLYEAMMQMSDGIGVNCGYCHNSRAFADWRQSTPARWTGYSGIQLTRNINRDYLLQIAHILPESRFLPGNPRYLSLPAKNQGPQRGNGLADCATCHHGAPEPLGGAAMAASFPALTAPATQAAAVAPASLTIPVSR